MVLRLPAGHSDGVPGCRHHVRHYDSPAVLLARRRGSNFVAGEGKRIGQDSVTTDSPGSGEKGNEMKEIMTLQETETEYIAKVKGETTIIDKNTFEMVNGIKEHPRMLAIEKAATKAGITEWYLLNV